MNYKVSQHFAEWDLGGKWGVDVSLTAEVRQEMWGVELEMTCSPGS